MRENVFLAVFKHKKKIKFFLLRIELAIKHL